jgi:hypothetical protein
MYRGMSEDVQGQDRIWIMQLAGRLTEAEQEMDHAACWQIDRDRTGDGSCSMSADGQRQDKRWIIQHVSRCTEASLMDRKGRTGDGSYSMSADGKRQDRRWIMQHVGI